MLLLMTLYQIFFAFIFLNRCIFHMIYHNLNIFISILLFFISLSILLSERILMIFFDSVFDRALVSDIIMSNLKIKQNRAVHFFDNIYIYKYIHLQKNIFKYSHCR